MDEQHDHRGLNSTIQTLADGFNATNRLIGEITNSLLNDVAKATWALYNAVSKGPGWGGTLGAGGGGVPLATASLPLGFGGGPTSITNNVTLNSSNANPQALAQAVMAEINYGLQRY